MNLHIHELTSSWACKFVSLQVCELTSCLEFNSSTVCDFVSSHVHEFTSMSVCEFTSVNSGLPVLFCEFGLQVLVHRFWFMILVHSMFVLAPNFCCFIVVFFLVLNQLQDSLVWTSIAVWAINTCMWKKCCCCFGGQCGCLDCLPTSLQCENKEVECPNW